MARRRNKRQNKKIQKIASQYVQQARDTSTIMDLALDQANIKSEEDKSKEVEQQEVSVPKKDISQSGGLQQVVININELSKNIAFVGFILKKINSNLEEQLDKRRAEEYQSEEQQLESLAMSRPSISSFEKEEKEGPSLFDSLKQLLLNPAVITAFSGIVYSILPKDVKEKITSFFNGFITEALGTDKELSTFKLAVMGAGAGIATFLGAKALESISSAIENVVNITNKAKGVFSKLFKGSAKFGDKIKSIGKTGKAAAAVGATAGAAVGVSIMSREDSAPSDKEELLSDKVPEQKLEPVPKGQPQPSTTRSVVASKAPLTGKPTAKTGSAPSISGDDASIMAMIKEHEGVRLTPYKDSLGLWTVGVGHLIGDGKTLPDEYNRTFTMQEVDDLFAKDYAHHKKYAERIPGYESLNSNGKAALIDLTFNMGPTWYKKWPRFVNSLRSGNVEQAADNLEDSLWYRQVGRRAPRIVALLRQGGEDSGIAGSEVLASAEKKTPLSEPSIQLASAPSMMGGQDSAIVSSQPDSQLATEERQTGMELASMSEEVTSTEVTQEPTVVNNVFDNSSIAKGKEETQAPPPIPSPIADRGTLALGIKHSTAYG